MVDTRTRSRGRAHKERPSLPEQIIVFAGLVLAPFLGLLVTWLLHYFILGVNLGFLSIPGSWLVLVITVLAISAFGFWLGRVAFEFAEHRTDFIRNTLCWSVVALTEMFALSVAVGPYRWLSMAFVIVGWGVAAMWAIARLDVVRPERTEGAGEKETFWSRLGVSKRTDFKAKIVHDEKTGEPVRLDIDVEHDRDAGETGEVFSEAGLGRFESAAGGPPGLASMTKDPEKAYRSTVSVPLVDPFKRNIPVGPLSAPGKSIAEWTTVADYANGQVGRVTIGGGLHTPSPTSYALIGMTRAGKTGTETQLLTDWGSRCDWVCLYLNQAKGLQDVRPLLPIIEAAIIAEGEGVNVDLGPYREAVQQVKAMMAYRQSLLGQFGVSAWTPRCAVADDAVRPSRVVNGVRQVMPRLPFLTVHLGEADALFTDGRLGDAYIYVSSKALSLGINTGTSLQKPDFRSMPTGVRSQIGLWFIHGLAESDDEEFVMDTSIRKAGANPGQWKAKKPGQHYMIGNGVEHEEWAPVALKTRFLIGSDTAPDGRRYTFDELNERYMAEMLRRNQQSARTQMRLDRGTAEATDGWWDAQVATTDALRHRMLDSQGVATTPSASASATSQPPASATSQTEDRATSQSRETVRVAKVPAGFRSQGSHTDDDEPTAEEMDEMHDEAAEVTEVEGIDLYDDPAIRRVDLTAERPPAPEFDDPEDDPLYDPEEEAKPGARDRAAALEALADALEEMLNDPSLRDPKDPTAVIVGPGMTADRYRFRERPWFSAEYAALAEGRGPLAARFDLTLAEDLGIRNGKYRLRRLTRSDDEAI